MLLYLIMNSHLVWFPYRREAGNKFMGKRKKRVAYIGLSYPIMYDDDRIWAAWRGGPPLPPHPILDNPFGLMVLYDELWFLTEEICPINMKTSVYKGYKRDKIEMRGDRAEMSDFPLYLNTVAGGLDRRDQTIGGFSFVVKIYAVPVVEIIG